MQKESPREKISKLYHHTADLPFFSTLLGISAQSRLGRQLRCPGLALLMRRRDGENTASERLIDDVDDLGGALQVPYRFVGVFGVVFREGLGSCVYGAGLVWGFPAGAYFCGNNGEWWRRR